MQEDAAEKLEELLIPIDVGGEIKRLGETKVGYRIRNAESSNL
jgi:hypothetical protein